MWSESTIYKLVYLISANCVLLITDACYLVIRGRREENEEWNLQGRERYKQHKLLSKFSPLYGDHFVPLPALWGQQMSQGDGQCPICEPGLMSSPISVALRRGQSD